MNKIKNLFKNIINFFRSIRVSTIYKIVGIVLLFAILLWIYTIGKQSITLKEKNQHHLLLSGKIINKGNDYIIIEDLSRNEYLIPTTIAETYSIGSEINVTIDKIVEQGTTNTPTIVSSNKINIINEKKENKNADSETINYIAETEKYLEDRNLQEEAKQRFINIVDFLFYNDSVNGYTLNDLTAKTKLKILKIVLTIDDKIEREFPGYKETISSTTNKVYTGIKIKIIENYLNTAVKICKYDKTLCETAKQDFQDIKKSFSITWDSIKNLIANSTQLLKEWYEIYSGKTS